MSILKIDDTLRMHYEIDNFADPWLTPEAILLVHGIGGSSAEWYAWVPRLARQYAVVRVDLRGFGKSSMPPEGYQWSMANFAIDLKTFLDKIGLQKVHLVGAKLGGRISLQFAHDYPERLRSLAVIGTPVTAARLKPDGTERRRPVGAEGEAGVKSWARTTMKDRLGDVPAEMSEWWIKLYSNNSPRIVSEVTDLGRSSDQSSLLPGIRVPTLVIVGEGNVVEPMDVIKRYQTSIPNSELVVIPDSGYHVSASKPDECASALLRFLAKLKKPSRR